MNKNICITGASSGIGRAVALQLASKGHAVAIGARRLERIKALSIELKKAGAAQVFEAHLDVSDAQSVDAFCADAQSKLGPIDVLINNAGGAVGVEHLVEAAPQDWQTMLNSNVLGTLLVTKHIASTMKQRNCGHIINIGSIAGYQVYPGGSVYCAAKHAVRAITETLKLELNGFNIRVSSIAPGLVDTEFSTVRFRGDGDRAEKVYEGMVPLKATDIAHCIDFVIGCPPHVNIDTLHVTPTAQATVYKVHRQ